MIGPGGVAGALAPRAGLRAKVTIVEDQGEDLAAGTLSVQSAGATSVDWSATDATGGTESYTYQLHRSTTQGFTPGPGTEVSGATSLTGTDTGRTESTTYYYRMEYDDGESVVYSDEVSATPTESTAAVDEDFEGMTVGQGPSGTSGILTWDGSQTNVSVSDDQAFSGTRSLKFHHRAKPIDEDTTAESGWTLDQEYDHLWIDFRWYLPANFFHREDPDGPDNQKFLRIWSGVYNDSDPKCGASFDPIGSGESKLYLQWGDHNTSLLAGQESGSNWNPAFTMDGRSGTHEVGTWGRYRLEFGLASDENSNDGVYRMWFGDTLILEKTGLDFFASDGSGFDEGYWMGWANVAYEFDTDFFMDELKIYTSDPGWI